jgi:large subunit ribosomal protein L22
MAKTPRETVREGRAVAKWLRTSPIKARRATDLIKNKPLMEARRLLAFTPLKATTLVSKVLESAVANATHNFDLPEERLYVHRAYVDEGIRIKRWMPRAYGRANRIHKPTAHITVIVRAKDQDAPAGAPGRGRKPSAARARGSS